MKQPLLEALTAGDMARAHSLVSFELPPKFEADALELFVWRRDQIRSAPETEKWLLRAIVNDATNRMIGYANFHGPPGINDTGEPNAVALGYTVFSDFRGQGFATEAGASLIEWAEREHGVARFVCGVLPDNAASMRVLEKLGFRRTALVVDGEAIFERGEKMA
jgi:[ribosomal protein S5]-alanine N-acetyltransferase